MYFLLKSLYGQYICTEIPGQFIWKISNFSKVAELYFFLKSSISIQWLKEGCLILLDNIDHGPADLISEIFTLSERRIFSTQNGTYVSVHQSSRLILTYTNSAVFKTNTSYVVLPSLRDFPYTFTLQPLTDENLNDILFETFPSLIAISSTLIQAFRNTFHTISSLNSASERSITSV